MASVKERVIIERDPLTREFSYETSGVRTPGDMLGLLALAQADIIARIAADMAVAKMRGQPWRDTTDKPDPPDPPPEPALPATPTNPGEWRPRKPL